MVIAIIEGFIGTFNNSYMKNVKTEKKNTGMSGAAARTGKLREKQK